MASAGPELNRRRAGVCLHLTSLPGSHGIGELGAPARRFMDWMQAHSLSVWQFLPTGPTGFGNSPYQPLSVFAGNPLLVDIGGLVEWGLLSVAEAAAAAIGNDGEVDYDRVAAVKGPLLARAAARFAAGSDAKLEGAFERFCAANDTAWLDDFAAYTLFKTRHGGAAWSEWPAAERRHGPGPLGQLRREDREGFERIKRIQFFFAEQWTELHAEASRRDLVLFGDVPIYMAYDCAEAWSRPGLLDLDESLRPLEVAGVPPDYFSDDGQLWGNPLYRWEAHAADGYRWWVMRLRRALAGADLVRLDHFRGFDAYWAVPSSAQTAREGRWKPGPGRALFDAIVQAFGRVPCVAENLGIITESVEALRKAYALPGMQVLQFLVDSFDFSVDRIDEDCICYTGTHDNDTTEGWFAGSRGRIAGDALERLHAGVLHNVEGAAESIHKAMINLSFRTKARIAIVPLQDFLGLGSSARLNTPGSAAGNWRWRVREAELAAPGLDYIRAGVVATGRA